jgi:hypothetical protein
VLEEEVGLLATVTGAAGKVLHAMSAKWYYFDMQNV